MIGLMRNKVKLCDHDPRWESEAERTISVLKSVLGGVAVDIRHVGSTSVRSIKAKPIIDIAVAVTDFRALLELKDALSERGIHYRQAIDASGEIIPPPVDFSTVRQLLFACGSYCDGTGNIQTHFIHAALENSTEFENYINFRDFLASHPRDAEAYEALKISLAEKYPNDRLSYTLGKDELINRIFEKIRARSYLGKTVDIIVDRPLGSTHPTDSGIVYPINYGYIPNTRAGDGEPIDVYILGENKSIESCRARIIAVSYRSNDEEDKLIAAIGGADFSRDEIKGYIDFQERYFDTELELARDYRRRSE